MKEWKEYKLGEIADITSSKRIFFSDYVSEGIPFYRSKEIIEKALGSEISTDLYISHERYNEIKEKYGAPIDGDILISAVGERAGIPYCVKNDGDFYFKDGNLIWFRNIDEKISPNFLVYFLNSFVGQQYLESTMIGSAQKALTIIGLKGLSVLFPPLPEQTAIATVLSSLDEKIDLLHRQNKTLEGLPEVVFRAWFVVGAEEGWEEAILREIAVHHKDSVNPSRHPETIFHHYSIPAFDDGKNPRPELGTEILSNKYKVVPNSIMVSKLNPRFPRIWALFGNDVPDNPICSTEFQIALPKKPAYFGFIYCFLKSYQVTQELIGAASGTSGSHQRVNPDDIFNLSFQMPPIKLIEEFDSFTKPFFEKIKTNTQQIRTLTGVRDTLLPKVMSGEIRVKSEK